MLGSSGCSPPSRAGGLVRGREFALRACWNGLAHQHRGRHGHSRWPVSRCGRVPVGTCGAAVAAPCAGAAWHGSGGAGRVAHLARGCALRVAAAGPCVAPPCRGGGCRICRSVVGHQEAELFLGCMFKKKKHHRKQFFAFSF